MQKMYPTHLGDFKKYVERRHSEPNKFIFQPNIGLLGSQVGNDEIVNYEL